jgi:hypothetical protein
MFGGECESNISMVDVYQEEPEDEVRVDAVVNPVGEECEVCGEFVEGFEYRTCCNAFDCGCMGKPVEPCVCSEECWNKMMKG